MSFRDDFDWQQGLIPHVKQVLAQYLIVEAPFEEDANHNTDLIVLKLDTVRVACRIRTFNFAKKYPDDFTIRSGRPSGAKTELAKVIEGWGDYIFYAFASEAKDGLVAWLLGDLKVFRLWYNRQLWAGRHPGFNGKNKDGSSDFMAFNVNALPDDFVTARKRYDEFVHNSANEAA